MWTYCCVRIVVNVLLCTYCCEHMVVYVLLWTYCCVRIVVNVLLWTYCCERVVVYVLLCTIHIHCTQNPDYVNPVVLGPEIECVTNSGKSCNGARPRAPLATSKFLFALSSHRIATSSIVHRGMKLMIIPWLKSALSVSLKKMCVLSVVSQQIIRQLLSTVTAFYGKYGDFTLFVYYISTKVKSWFVK
jgi:hypothetical protein